MPWATTQQPMHFIDLRAGYVITDIEQRFPYELIRLTLKLLLPWKKVLNSSRSKLYGKKRKLENGLTWRSNRMDIIPRLLHMMTQVRVYLKSMHFWKIVTHMDFEVFMISATKLLYALPFIFCYEFNHILLSQNVITK